MSSDDSSPGVLKQAYRTVSPRYRSRHDTEMDAVGWGIFLALLFLIVPLLPFIVLVWVISKAFEAVTPSQ